MVLAYFPSILYSNITFSVIKHIIMHKIVYYLLFSLFAHVPRPILFIDPNHTPQQTTNPLMARPFLYAYFRLSKDMQCPTAELAIGPCRASEK